MVYFISYPRHEWTLPISAPLKEFELKHIYNHTWKNTKYKHNSFIEEYLYLETPQLIDLLLIMTGHVVVEKMSYGNWQQWFLHNEPKVFNNEYEPPTKWTDERGSLYESNTYIKDIASLLSCQYLCF